MLTNPDEQTLRGIGLLYLACTHAMDGELTEQERDLIVHKIEGRLVSADERAVYGAVREAVAAYGQHKGEHELGAKVHDVAVDLAAKMDPADLAVIVADLVDMARTDGAVTSPEREFISDVAQSFQVATPDM